MRFETRMLAAMTSGALILSILACTRVDDDNNDTDAGTANNDTPDADEQDTGPVDTRTMVVVDVDPPFASFVPRELGELEGALDAALCFSSPPSATGGFALQGGTCNGALLNFLSVESKVDDIYIAPGSGFTLSSYSTGSIVNDSPMGRPALLIGSFDVATLVISDDSAPDTTFTLDFTTTIDNKVNAKVETVTYATP